MLALLAAAGAPAAQAQDTLRATPKTLAATYERADGGDRIELAAGDYGILAGAEKDAPVTLAPAPGAAASIGFELEGAGNLRVEGLEVTSAAVIDSHDVTFAGNRFTGPVLIETTRDGDHRILFDGNRHEDIDICDACHAGRITVLGHENRAPNGVRIANSLFTGGNSDGVLVTGGAYGTRIGPGNHFVDMPMVDDTHTDAIQLYGSSHTVITGNLIDGTATGIMAADGADHELIEDNVIVTLGYPWGIVLGGDVGSVIRHNTLPDGACDYELRCGLVRLDAGNQGRPGTGTVVAGNVVGGISLGEGSETGFEDGNLVGPGGGGEGPTDVEGVPVFAGWSWPAGWSRFTLALRSAGNGVPDLGARVRAAEGLR